MISVDKVTILMLFLIDGQPRKSFYKHTEFFIRELYI